MANHKSAIKRHKQSLKRAQRNRLVNKQVKRAIKAVRLAVVEKDASKSSEALQAATSVLDKAASKGVLHWKTAARKISRLAKSINKISAE